MNKKKKMIGMALLVLLALVFSGCENAYIKELLYGPSTLKSITITTDEQQAYSLQPYFSDNRYDYEATVPLTALSISVEALPHLDGKVCYSLGDGINFGNKCASGYFDFPAGIERVVVRMQVLRPNMAETTYTLTVKRADFLLRGITVLGGSNLSELDPKPLLLSPGFLPETYTYAARVFENVEALRVTGLSDPQKAHMYYNLDTQVPNSRVFSPGDPKYIEFNFPSSADLRMVWIQVRPLDINGNEKADEWKNYQVIISRGKKVSFDSALWTAFHSDELFRFEIDGVTTDYNAPGSPEKTFGPGDPVVFSLMPPFGYRIGGPIEIVHDPGGPNEHVETKPVSPSNSYVFLMLMEHISIRVNFEPYKSAADVRYVWEHGTGDGSSWANATSDLQAVIDKYNNTPGHPDNYEIWIAKGNYTPDWTRLSAEAQKGWAGKLLPHQKQKGSEIYWTFVLGEGVKILGGFSGREETLFDRDRRDIKANETILSGDVNDNKTARILSISGISYAYVEGLTLYGSFTPNTMSEFSYTINNTEQFTSCGGVLYVMNASPLLRNVTMRYGQASGAGGLVVVGNSCPVLINCNFDHNKSFDSAVSNDGSSEGLGSAIGLMTPAMSNVIPNMVMIGGKVSGNWTYGGAVNLEYGKSTLINVSITDNLEHAIIAKPSHKISFPLPSHYPGNNVFINLTITGNRGANSSTRSQYSVKGNGQYGIAASLYNCVVKDNKTDTSSNQANVDPGTPIENTIAPDHPNDIGGHNNYLDRGKNEYYPVDSSGNWNSSSPVYTYLFTPKMLSPEVLEEIRLALLKDGNGNQRFRGSSIDLGAEEL